MLSKYSAKRHIRVHEAALIEATDIKNASQVSVLVGRPSVERPYEEEPFFRQIEATKAAQCQSVWGLVGKISLGQELALNASMVDAQYLSISRAWSRNINSPFNHA